MIEKTQELITNISVEVATQQVQQVRGIAYFFFGLFVITFILLMRRIEMCKKLKAKLKKQKQND